MAERRLLVARTSDAEGSEERAFAAARRLLAAGDEVVLVGRSTPEGVARAAVAEDASVVVVAGDDEGAGPVRDALADLGADDVEVVAAGPDEPLV